MDRNVVVSIGHWLPILTICPVNKLPDLIYIRVEFTNIFAELYAVRRKVRQLISCKTMFMEDIATTVLDAFPHASQVQVSLAFNRHIVTLSNYALHLDKNVRS